MAVLIIFLATTQLGLHFWPLSSLVYGIRIDYLSPTLYFLDLLILLYLGLKFRSFSGLQQSERQIGTLSLVPLLLTNLLFSQNPLASLNWSLHLLLYFSFLVALFPKFRSFSGLQQSERQIGTSVITIALTFALLFQLTLGFFQFYLGHSVGGLLYYFGERMVSVGSPGIATASFMGQVVLRAYGTFSHPNILAGWSVIVLLTIIKLRPKLALITLSLTSLVIFLTNSRSVLLSLFGFVVPLYFLHSLKSHLIYFALLLVSIFYLLPSSLLSRTDLSFSERLSLQQVSLKVASAYPVFGTGSQSSISTYPLVSPVTRLLQPDHNSFTLFFSWFGLFGILTMSPWFRSFSGLQQSKRQIGTFVITFAPLLPLLLLDHYLLTSPQGLFILLLYLVVGVNYSHAQKNR